MKTYEDLLKKIEKATKKGGVDLSSDEDLSIAVMNLVSIEEHFFFTADKTRCRETILQLPDIDFQTVPV